MPKLDKNTVIGALMLLGGGYVAYMGFKRVF